MKIFLASDIHTEVAHRNFDPKFDYECLRFDYPTSGNPECPTVSDNPGCPTTPDNQEISENHSSQINPAYPTDSDEPNEPDQADVIILAGDIGEWINGVKRL
jgi:hypothetical protein